MQDGGDHVAAVHSAAEQRGHPLRAGAEKE
jgi:hypothetical protein